MESNVDQLSTSDLSLSKEEVIKRCVELGWTERKWKITVNNFCRRINGRATKYKNKRFGIYYEFNKGKNPIRLRKSQQWKSAKKDPCLMLSLKRSVEVQKLNCGTSSNADNLKLGYEEISRGLLRIESAGATFVFAGLCEEWKTVKAHCSHNMNGPALQNIITNMVNASQSMASKRTENSVVEMRLKLMSLLRKSLNHSLPCSMAPFSRLPSRWYDDKSSYEVSGYPAGIKPGPIHMCTAADLKVILASNVDLKLKCHSSTTTVASTVCVASTSDGAYAASSAPSSQESTEVSARALLSFARDIGLSGLTEESTISKLKFEWRKLSKSEKQHYMS